MGARAAVMNLVLVLLERGAISRSISLAREMLDACLDLADTSLTTARCVEIVAQVLSEIGSLDAAVLLVSSAAHHRQALGAPVPPGESVELQRLLESTRGPPCLRAASASLWWLAAGQGNPMPPLCTV